MQFYNNVGMPFFISLLVMSVAFESVNIMPAYFFDQCLFYLVIIIFRNAAMLRHQRQEKQSYGL